MTLQPMTTAPMDGREVLLEIRPQRRAGVARLWAKWNDKVQTWESGAGYHSDDYFFSGWLDIEPMARDADLFRHIARSQIRVLSGPPHS